MKSNNINYTPLVCVRCMTFNHEAYIEDALNGFVIQQTTFPFVVAIINDASTDKTKSVINEFVENNCIHNPEIDLRIEEYGTVLDVTVKDNPHCIFHIVHLNENHYGKKSKLPYFAKYENAAKYVAMCEGDDYWTDPLKLQKQVDFMEANEECVLCFTNATVISDDPQERKIYDHLEERDYSAIEIYKTWTIPTNTIMWRRLQDYPSRTFKDIYFGDIFLFLNLAVRGRVHCLNQKTGVYRRNGGGISFQMSLVKAQRLIKQYLFMMHHFKDYPDLVEYSKYCVQVYCWYIMYESDASIWEKFRYLRLERNISDTKMLTKSTLSYCLTLIKKTILHRK